MSYRPPRPTGGYVPPAGPSNYNVSGARVRRRGAGVPWLAGCGLLLLGAFIGALALFALAIFYFGSPPNNQPLPRRDFTGTADVSATLSESYLNAALTKYVKDNPITLGGLLGVKDIVLNIQPNQRVGVQLRVSGGPAVIDINVTEAIGVQNGKIVLKPVGQPSVGKGNLPLPADKVVELANTIFVEPQINQNLAQVEIDKRKFQLVDVSTADGLITVRFNGL